MPAIDRRMEPRTPDRTRRVGRRDGRDGWMDEETFCTFCRSLSASAVRSWVSAPPSRPSPELNQLSVRVPDRGRTKVDGLRTLPAGISWCASVSAMRRRCRVSGRLQSKKSGLAPQCLPVAKRELHFRRGCGGRGEAAPSLSDVKKSIFSWTLVAAAVMEVKK